MTDSHGSGPVLEVQDLRVEFRTDAGPAHAVAGVSFALRPGERLGLVGELGSGKTTMVQAIMRMIKPPGRIAGGLIRLEGRNLLELSERQMRAVRFAQVALIPQGAMSSLNPVIKIKEQLADVMGAHGMRLSERELDARIGLLLSRVGLRPDAARLYPHELSGGMKQRVCIAMSIALEPRVVVADEPTSALDVIVQKQVLGTLREVQEAIGAAVILVGHDMGLMAQFADRIGVMYAGRLVEIGPVREIFKRPGHPYTRMLISSLPTLGQRGVFRGIPGIAPSLLDPPPGCSFHPRCPRAESLCSREVPPDHLLGPGRRAACHFAGELPS